MDGRLLEQVACMLKCIHVLECVHLVKWSFLLMPETKKGVHPAPVSDGSFACANPSCRRFFTRLWSHNFLKLSLLSLHWYQNYKKKFFRSLAFMKRMTQKNDSEFLVERKNFQCHPVIKRNSLESNERKWITKRFSALQHKLSLINCCNEERCCRQLANVNRAIKRL